MASKIAPGRQSEATCVKRGSKHAIWLHFGSIAAPFGTLGPPRVRFFAFRDALARTCAHAAGAGAILSEFGCPRGGQKLVGGTSGATSGREVKLHLAPLDGDIVRVSARSAISDACTACMQLT